MPQLLHLQVSTWSVLVCWDPCCMQCYCVACTVPDQQPDCCCQDTELGGPDGAVGHHYAWSTDNEGRQTSSCAVGVQL